MYGHTYSKSVDQPGKVLNPARSWSAEQRNEYFPVPVRAREFGLARRFRQYRPASVCSSPYSGGIWCLLTGSLPSSTVMTPIYLFRPPYAIGSVPSYRVTQLRTNGVHCRESAGTGPVNLKVVSSERVLPWQVTMDQLIRASFPTPTIDMKWAC